VVIGDKFRLVDTTPTDDSVDETTTSTWKKIDFDEPSGDTRRLFPVTAERLIGSGRDVVIGEHIAVGI